MSFRGILEEGRRQHEAALAEERAAHERERQWVEAQGVARRVLGRAADAIAASWDAAMRAANHWHLASSPKDDEAKNDEAKDEERRQGPPPPPRWRRGRRRRGHGAASTDGWDEAMEAIAPDEAASALDAGSRMVVKRPETPAGQGPMYP